MGEAGAGGEVVGAGIALTVVARSASDEAIQLLLNFAKAGLLRGACHRARIRATRWLATKDRTVSRKAANINFALARGEKPR